MRCTKMIHSRVQNKYGQWVTCDLPDNGQWSPHVQFYEIANPSSKENIILELPIEARIHRDAWEVWRNWYGKPVKINCGYRTPKYNKAVNGASNSQHLKCCAYDLALGAVTDAFFKSCIDVCFAIAESFNTQCELGRYPWGLHIGFSKLDYTSKRVFTFDKR